MSKRSTHNDQNMRSQSGKSYGSGYQGGDYGDINYDDPYATAADDDYNDIDYQSGRYGGGPSYGQSNMRRSGYGSSYGRSSYDQSSGQSYGQGGGYYGQGSSQDESSFQGGSSEGVRRGMRGNAMGGGRYLQNDNDYRDDYEEDRYAQRGYGGRDDYDDYQGRQGRRGAGRSGGSPYGGRDDSDDYSDVGRSSYGQQRGMGGSQDWEQGQSMRQRWRGRRS